MSDKIVHGISILNSYEKYQKYEIRLVLSCFNKFYEIQKKPLNLIQQSKWLKFSYSKIRAIKYHK